MDSLVDKNKLVKVNNRCKLLHLTPFPYNVYDRTHEENYNLFKPDFLLNNWSKYQYNHHNSSCVGGEGISSIWDHIPYDPEVDGPKANFPPKTCEIAPWCAIKYLRNPEKYYFIPPVDIQLNETIKKYNGKIKDVNNMLSCAAPETLEVEEIISCTECENNEIKKKRVIKKPILMMNGDVYRKVKISDSDRQYILKNYVIPEFHDRSQFYSEGSKMLDMMTPPKKRKMSKKKQKMNNNENNINGRIVVIDNEINSLEEKNLESNSAEEEKWRE